MCGRNAASALQRADVAAWIHWWSVVTDFD
jgi:hypothetical protein